MTTITLGSVVFPPTSVPGRSAFHRGLVGWYDLTNDKAKAVERPRAHGAFASPASWRSSAAVSFTVVISADDEAELLRSVEELGAIGADGPVELTVTDALRTTSRVVSVRATTVKDHRGFPVGEVDFDCLATDPRRYSIADEWVQTRPPAGGGGLRWPAVWPAVWERGGTSGRITLTNRGTKASSPLYRVAGGFEAFTITNVSTQQRLGFALPVPAGSVVELDAARRTAVIDGQSNVSRFLTAREWWDVPAGSSSTAQLDVTGDDGAATLSGIVRSAW